MIRSMTGYGAAELATDAGRLSTEIRSVNHRYCEISLRLPRSITGLEGQVRSLLGERIARGKVTANVTWEGYEEESGRLRVNHEVARQYLGALSELKTQYELAGEPTLQGVSALPDVFRWERAAVDQERLWGQVRQAVEAAVEAMTRMKEREGEALEREFELRLGRIEERLAIAEKRAPLRPAEARDKMLARLKPLLEGVEVDPTRLAQEVAFLAERLDCTEECVRLRAHVDQFRRLFKDAELAGRKLNFLLQEMNREVNTLGSKANDPALAGVVIELKDEVEKLREQVQNVE